MAIILVGSYTLSNSLEYDYRGHVNIHSHFSALPALFPSIRFKLRHLKVGMTPWKPLSGIWGVWAMAAATGPLSGIFG